MNTSEFDDIIDTDYKPSSSRKRMTACERAAQFAPFSALSGFGELMSDAAKTSDDRPSLDDDVKAVIERKLRMLSGMPGANVAVEYYDGTRKRVMGIVSEVNFDIAEIRLKGGEGIPFDELCDISGAVDFDC